MDLRFLVSISNFLNFLIQIFLVIIVIYIYLNHEDGYSSQPWILFISICVAILYFINVGYMSIERVEYLDSKLLNIDVIYVIALVILGIGTTYFIKSYKIVDSAISDALSLLVLAITIATNFWAPKITKLICKIFLK